MYAGDWQRGLRAASRKSLRWPARSMRNLGAIWRINTNTISTRGLARCRSSHSRQGA